jgi:8-oxo-dGTP diphosphatase
LAVPEPSPRLRVAALIPMDGAIVLVRHVKDGSAYHLLPGGGVEMGESLADALVREVREETGLVVAPDRLLFLNDSIAGDGSRHMVQVTFLARVVGGEITASPLDPRVEAVEAVGPDDLAKLDLRPPMAAELKAAASAGYHIPAAYLGALWSEPISVGGTREKTAPPT